MSLPSCWQAGVEQFDELCGIDCDWLSMDGVMTKAPLGGEKTGPDPTDRGKSGVKCSLLTEGYGVPKSGRTIWRFSILPVA